VSGIVKTVPVHVSLSCRIRNYLLVNRLRRLQTEEYQPLRYCKSLERSQGMPLGQKKQQRIMTQIERAEGSLGPWRWSEKPAKTQSHAEPLS